MNSFEKRCPEKDKRQKTTANLIQKARSVMAEGLIQKRNLVWLELNGCSGNIISLVDGFYPNFEYLITEMTNFIYNNSLSAAEGEQASDILFSVLGSDYILAVEGAVSMRDNGMYNIVGRYRGSIVSGFETVRILGEGAAHVIAVGACATHGGVSAARPNPSGCVGVQSVLQRKVINLPGCPCHPDWFMGTVAHLILYGEPVLDSQNRPVMFYGTTIHDRCPRRSYFDARMFAEKLGDKTCMFNLGCRGPVTYTDCPIRQWNGYVSWPVENDSPCIGCAQFGFPDASEPFVSYDTTSEVE